MRKNQSPVLVVALLGLTLVASGCAPAAQTNVPSTAAPIAVKVTAAATYTDPFAYCAAVENIDEPDARYTGEKAPDAIIKGFIKASGGDVTMDIPDAFRDMTIWRCMDQQVYACNFGANLPCSSKANTDKTPTQAMIDFCKENVNAEFIPMAWTGHSTIYSWRCVNDAPELLDQIAKADAAGFLDSIWYPIVPTP